MARTPLEHRLRPSWARRGLLAHALWPLAQLHGAVAATRRRLYAGGHLPSAHLPVPVIVVGNVIAGGAGKTPTTLAIADHLKASGWRPGIASRGYGRQSEDVRQVHADADPREVGDEPLLLHRRGGVPVVVGARRADAGRALLAAHPEVDVLLCDDGLQHLALARDIEIVVFDSRGVGNGWLLPAGPLREPWPRPADLVLYTEPPAAAVLPGLRDAQDGHQHAATFVATRSLAKHAIGSDGSSMLLDLLQGRPLTALAAIARPEAFFSMLHDAGLTLAECIALPDHDALEQLPPSLDTSQLLLCTEKDAAKLWKLRPDALAVPLELDIPADFWKALDSLLATTANRPRR